MNSAKDNTITTNEFDELYKVLLKPKHKIILLLGARAGLRVQEINQCRTSWLEIVKINDNDVLAINIPDECRDLKNKYALWRPKSKKKRTTYILDNGQANYVFHWFANNEEGINLTRQHITTNIIKEVYRKVINKQITTHGLRATCQNYWGWTLGLDIRFIQACLGHVDYRTTMKHYQSMNKESTQSMLESYLVK